MKKKFLASALAASMVGTMFASMPAFAEEESSSAVGVLAGIVHFE